MSSLSNPNPLMHVQYGSTATYVVIPPGRHVVPSRSRPTASRCSWHAVAIVPAVAIHTQAKQGMQPQRVPGLPTLLPYPPARYPAAGGSQGSVLDDNVSFSVRYKLSLCMVANVVRNEGYMPVTYAVGKQAGSYASWIWMASI